MKKTGEFSDFPVFVALNLLDSEDFFCYNRMIPYCREGGARVAFDMLIGNDALRARLQSDVETGRLSHAYLIEGASGSGRGTLATALAAALACEERGASSSLPCGRCKSCRKVLEGKSPDVIRIRRDGKKASIGVDEVRFLRGDVCIQPNDLDTKIYIIEEADLMTAQAQNALLLTLEEPPSYALFLLLCERGTALLETIRSRAPLLRMERIPRETMRSHLNGRSRAFAALDVTAQSEILLLAEGSIGRALALADPDERAPLIERRGLAARYVAAVLERADVETMLSLMADIGIKRDKVSARREELVALLEDVLKALRDLILLKRADRVSLSFYTDEQAALELGGRASLQALLSLTDAVEAARRQLLRNANVRLAMTSLFFLT